jgi:hypothetical protein
MQMNNLLNSYIQFDGYAFLIIGIVVLISPSPQPGLSKPVNEEDLLPFSQTRRLLASMFIASALLLIIIGRNIFDPETLKEISIARIASFLLVIILNAIQHKSKRWKAAPLMGLITLFSIMSLIYIYLIYRCR